MTAPLAASGILFILLVIGAPLFTPIRRVRLDLAVRTILLSGFVATCAWCLSFFDRPLGGFPVGACALVVLEGTLFVAIGQQVLYYRRLHRHLIEIIDGVRGVGPLTSWLMRLDAGSRAKRGSARLLVLRAAEVLIEVGRYDEVCEVLDAVHLGEPARYQGARGRVLCATAELGRGDVGAAAAVLAPAHIATHIAVTASIASLRALFLALEGEYDEAERFLATVPPRTPAISAGTLARAHCLVAREQEAAAAEVIRALAPLQRRMVLTLAQSAPGPASALAARLEMPEAPYR